MVDTESGEFTEKSLTDQGNAVREFYAAFTNTIPFWLIAAKNILPAIPGTTASPRSPSSGNVLCLTTQPSRDLVLANHTFRKGQHRGHCLRYVPRLRRQRNHRTTVLEKLAHLR
jgi:hypothetical protein